jgi:hypothetical protein
MDIQTLQQALADRFGPALNLSPPDAFEVKTADFQLLVLLSPDHSWLRLLVPIGPASEAEPFWEQLLEANFDQTQAARYALHDNVLWVTLQQDFDSLTQPNLDEGITTLLTLKEAGLTPLFNSLIEKQISLIITVSKRQGKTLAETMQTLDRFYAEGMLGGLNQTSGDRESTLAAWRFQLERLWGAAS